LTSTCATSNDLEIAFAEFGDAVERRVRSILGCPAAAEDVRQETFLRAWKHAPSTGSPGSLRAWLLRTATNLALDELRRRRRRLESSLDPATHTAPPDREDTYAREILARLSPHDRFVILMRFEAGLTSAELGALLGIAEGAARKRVERARRQFQAQFASSESAARPPAIDAPAPRSRRSDFMPLSLLGVAGPRSKQA
jgi:RNA polymerase sigma factor (sigma-70 family)